MSQSPDVPHPDPVPLVVDLDGTLIKTDLLWEHLARLLRRNPLWLLPILLWWVRGRAFLKRQLARRIKIDPATLPYQRKKPPGAKSFWPPHPISRWPNP